MIAISDTVISSLVAGGFTVIVAMIGLLARANKREHGENSGKLDRVLEATDFLKRSHERIETKIDNHIDNHGKGIYQ